MNLTQIISEAKFIEIVKKLASNSNFFDHFLNEHNKDSSFSVEKIRQKSIMANFAAKLGYKTSNIDLKCEDFDRWFKIWGKTANYKGIEYYLFTFEPDGYGKTRITLSIKREPFKHEIDSILELILPKQAAQ